MSDQYFRINAPDVVSETIDGEAVIINLYKGLYYNLNETGSLIWTLLESGIGSDAVLQALKAQYEVTAEDEAKVQALLDQLQQESLIVPVESNSQSTPGLASASASLKAFEPPILYKYADMQDLLALDPIHDVDETGWPNQPDRIPETVG